MAFQAQQRMRWLTRRSDAFVEENINGFTLFHTRGPCGWLFSLLLLFSFTHRNIINAKRLYRNDVGHASFTLTAPQVVHFTKFQIMRHNLPRLCALACLTSGCSGIHYQRQHSS